MKYTYKQLYDERLEFLHDMKIMFKSFNKNANRMEKQNNLATFIRFCKDRRHDTIAGTFQTIGKDEYQYRWNE